MAGGARRRPELLVIMAVNEWMNEGRKEGRTDGWTDNELVIYGWSAATAPARLPCHMHAKKERTDIDAHNANATWRSCRLREYFDCWVERGASCMESAVWGYWGCWLERGACHARQERTDMDVYGRNTNCVASIVGVQIAVISKEMKFILGRLQEIHLLPFFGISFFFWM